VLLMGETEFAQFAVPSEEMEIGGGQWIWEVANWRGVRSATLSGTAACVSAKYPAYLEVTATLTAMQRVRRFCTERGYTEVKD
jgi:hypothetical protein